MVKPLMPTGATCNRAMPTMSWAEQNGRRRGRRNTRLLSHFFKAHGACVYC